MRSRYPVLWIVCLGVIALLGDPTAAQAQGTLFVEADKVGIGTDTPTEYLHIKSSNPGSTLAFLEHTAGTGVVGSRYKSTKATWDFRMDGAGSFIFDHTATAGEDLNIQKSGQIRVGPAPAKIILQPNGDIEIEGSLFEGSSRTYKEDLEAMDGREVLARVSQLPVMEWSYKNRASRHVGPMAEDFHALFGLGDDPKALAPRDVAGVALLALQGLHQTVQERDAEIEELQRELAELRAIVETLASDRSR